MQRKSVGDREILETYSNSASKNTSETDIFPHGQKSLLTSVISNRTGTTSKLKYGQGRGSDVCVKTLLNNARALPIFWFWGGPCRIVNHLVKIAVAPVTAYMESEEASSLVFQYFKTLQVDSPVL